MMSGIYSITVQDSLIFHCVTPGTFLQYASAGHITKSAEERGCLGEVWPAAALPAVRLPAHTPVKLEGKDTSFSCLAFYTNLTHAAVTHISSEAMGAPIFPSVEAPEGNLGFKAGVQILLQRNY